jgi:plastocyanin
MSIRTTTLIRRPWPFASARLSTLEAVTLVTSLAITGLFAYILVTNVEAPGVAAIFGALGLVVAGLILIVRRWTPVLGSLFALLVGLLVVGPAPGEVARSLSQPADPLYFPLIVVLPLIGFAIVCGLAATAENVRRSRPGRSTPSWLVPLVTALLGAWVCGSALGALPRPTVVQAMSSSFLSSIPVVRTAGFQFDQTELHVRTGETVALRLQKSDATTHTFTVDEFGVDVPVLPGEANVALFVPARPGTYTFYCKPHYDPTTGQGMHGRLVVDYA